MVPTNDTDPAPTPSARTTDADARQAVLTDGFPIPLVRVDGQSVLRRRGKIRYDHRPVNVLPGRLFPVTGSGRQYNRRGERPFVMGRELAPKPCRRYVTSKRTGRKVIVKSLLPSSVTPNVMAAYHEILESFPRLLLHPSIYGTGLFTGENVERGRILIEYTGNRVRGSSEAKMHRELNRLDQNPDVFASMEYGKVTLYLRGCGNEAMCVNHSCNPNAVLYEMIIGPTTVLFIKALRPILAARR